MMRFDDDQCESEGGSYCIELKIPHTNSFFRAKERDS